MLVDENKLTIEMLIKKINNKNIRFDHPLQRGNEQWSKLMIGNLISDILQGNPIPDLIFAEQKIGDHSIIWNIDGKQRCMGVRLFVSDKYTISNNITRYMLEYPVITSDHRETIHTDQIGNPICNIKKFDIRGKKFKDLPGELQQRFLNFCFGAVNYYDCSHEDISYHIGRYNEGRPMTKSQKGMAHLGVPLSLTVKKISAMSFFVDAVGNYTPGQFKNGTIYRIIVESIIITRFPDNWSKEYEKNCKFLKINVKTEDIEFFKNLVKRLEKCIDDKVGEIFNAKYSFLWFGLFSKFIVLGLKDKHFNDFMIELADGMKVKKNNEMTGICKTDIDGSNFETLLKNSSTKDKKIVFDRLDHLEKLMRRYFMLNNYYKR